MAGRLRGKSACRGRDTVVDQREAEGMRMWRIVVFIVVAVVLGVVVSVLLVLLGG